MRWPLDLPPEFSYCRKANSVDELVRLLSNHSDEHVVEFFEAAGFDEMWSSEYPEYPAGIFKWASNEFIRDRLSYAYAERIVRTVLEHYRTLHFAICYDTQFKVQDNTVDASSLMCAIASEFLRDLLRREEKLPEQDKFEINLRLITFDLLKQILEYIHSGQIQKVNELSQEELMALLRQSTLWKVTGLAKLVAKLLKKFIYPDNLLELVKLSHEEKLTELKQSCFDYIHKQYPEIEISMKTDIDFIVEIKEWKVRNQEFLESIAPFMTHLIAHNKVPSESSLERIIRPANDLKSIDFSYSSEVDTEVLQAVAASKIEALNLSHCVWANQQHFNILLTGLTNLLRLNLSGNAHLDISEIHVIPKFTKLLGLNLAECENINNELMIAIGFGCQELNDFTITDNPEIADYGIVMMAKSAQNLVSLNVSNCNGITEQGFIEFAAHRPNLISLVARRCKGITENSLAQITLLCPNLRLLDIKGCTLPNPGLVDELRKAYPYIHIP